MPLRPAGLGGTIRTLVFANAPSLQTLLSWHDGVSRGVSAQSSRVPKRSPWRPVSGRQGVSGGRGGRRPWESMGEKVRGVDSEQTGKLPVTP